MRKIYLLDEDRIDHYWKDIEDLLGQVPGWYDLYDPQWTYCEAKMGHLQLWALSDGQIEGIVVTKIAVFPRARVLEIMGAAGIGLLKYFDEIDGTLDWLARDSECSFIRVQARPGVARKLRNRAVQESVVLTRRVSQEKTQ